MYGLNPTAGYLWQASDGASSLERLAQHLAGEGAPAPELGALERFCAELEELGLLERVDGGPESEEAAELPSPPEAVEAPEILWREEVRQAAGTCAFFPTKNPLCNQVPFS